MYPADKELTGNPVSTGDPAFPFVNFTQYPEACYRKEKKNENRRE
jgi:hypothetical protein